MSLGIGRDFDKQATFEKSKLPCGTVFVSFKVANFTNASEEKNSKTLKTSKSVLK